MIVYHCDLCDRVKECLPKEIDGRKYDICHECWARLAAKLKGKGRARKKERSDVYLPPVKIDERDDAEPDKPFPGAPPRIWLRSEVVKSVEEPSWM
jgi:hypothetical protein